MTATELNLPPFPDTTVGQLGAVTFIGTATVLVQYGTLTFLTDPNFLHAGDHAHLGYGLRSKRLTNPALELSELPPRLRPALPSSRRSLRSPRRARARSQHPDHHRAGQRQAAPQARLSAHVSVGEVGVDGAARSPVADRHGHAGPAHPARSPACCRASWEAW